MNCFVTGVSGFIGSNLVHELKKAKEALCARVVLDLMLSENGGWKCASC